MKRFLRELRLVPIVLFATISLFVLKTVGLILDGHYALEGARILDEAADITGTTPLAKSGAPDARGPAVPPAKGGKQSWAQQMFNYPDVTGAVGDGKPPGPQATPPPDAPPTKDDGTPPQAPNGKRGWTPVPLDDSRLRSPAEIAVLERLQERRAELEARSKELDMRESLLKAAEKRLEARLAELKDLESRMNNALGQRDEGETARFKKVVTMYENMKAKDAAKIFDRLDMKVLVEVATQIEPRRMSDILAQMSPEAAERLTVELAARSGSKEKTADLPKIDGKPNPN